VSHRAAVALTGHSTIFFNPYAAMPSLHSVVRAGIGAIVASEPDLELVGAAGSEQELWPLLPRAVFFGHWILGLRTWASWLAGANHMRWRCVRPLEHRRRYHVGHHRRPARLCAGACGQNRSDHVRYAAAAP
jgi:hypothetical protein